MTDWEKNWRGNGVSAEKLTSFYDGDSTRILISVVIYGFAVLCLLWFAAAVASVLRDAGKGGRGAAATAASAAIGGIYARWVPTLTMLAWITAVSVFLVRRHAAAAAPDQAAVATP